MIQKRYTKTAILLLIFVLVVLTSVSMASAAEATIGMDLNKNYKVIPGETTTMRFSGAPASWNATNGILWEYKLSGTDQWISMTDKRLNSLSSEPIPVKINGINAKIFMRSPSAGGNNRISTLIIENTPASLDGIQFRASVGKTPVYSNVADLYVYDRVAIKTNPKDVTVFEEQNAEFSAEPASTGGMTYQWYKGSVSSENKLAGKTDQILAFENVQKTDAGTYTFVVTGPVAGPENTASASAQLTVLDLPTVTATASHIVLGDSVTFTATGSDGLTYQWYKGTPASGEKIDGKTGKTFIIENAGQDAAGTYYVEATHTASGAKATSEPVSLSVLFIQTQPSDTYGFINNYEPVSLKVELPELDETAGTMEYQWFKGTPESEELIAGATSSELTFDPTINPIQKEDEGNYFVVVTQEYDTEKFISVTSEVAKLTVFELAATPNPVTEEESVIFSIVGTDGQEIAGEEGWEYMWFEGNGIDDLTSISGETGKKYEITSMPLSKNGFEYAAVIKINDHEIYSNILVMNVEEKSEDDSGNGDGEDDDGGNEDNDDNENEGNGQNGGSGGIGNARVLPPVEEYTNTEIATGSGLFVLKETVSGFIPEEENDITPRRTSLIAIILLILVAGLLIVIRKK
ncbi:hypothetical protein [Methanolapillus ohkumae]|uniref:Ig-like domain-containing protein n=1 Tax=Methanolapillus ohkumae TaxID=3028298 RepID=A0AA96V5Q4_9EURY|nr:hypothetical protein MsAm2_01420 [Methanosarcinaceae archaeon Am2]